jgi:hypothetical protein
MQKIEGLHFAPNGARRVLSLRVYKHLAPNGAETGRSALLCASVVNAWLEFTKND